MRGRGSHRFRDQPGGLEFSRRELLDLVVAWIVLGVAFALFFVGGGDRFLRLEEGATWLVGVSLLSAGVAFLLHELAHKVVAVWFDQIAEFRADYGMLFVALMAAFAGWLFAAPGAVYHRGRITPRERGLIALAGPVTNLALAPLFLALTLFPPGFLSAIGEFGVPVTLLLAGFNMIPFGPLDGRTVLDWSPPVFAVVFVPSALLAIGVFFPGVVSYHI